MPADDASHPNDDLLIALHDGVLFPADRAAVQTHLEQCPDCRIRLTALTGPVAPRPSAPPPPPTRTREAPAEPAPAPAAARPVEPAVALPAHAITRDNVRREVLKRLAIVIVLFGAVGLAFYGRRELARQQSEPVPLASTPTAPTAPPPPQIAPVPEPPEPAPPADPEQAAAIAKLVSVEDTTTPSLVVTTPNRNFRWRIVGGQVERTTDGGKRWRKQNVAMTSAIKAGTAPSAAVCWLVGDNGLVLTALGGDWKRVTSPAPVSLVGVAALDSMNATVTAADGRQFSTGNGGMTWNVVP